MNRISVRGVGMAAAALAATSLTAGGLSAAADDSATVRTLDVSPVDLNTARSTLGDQAEQMLLHRTAAAVALRHTVASQLQAAARAKATLAHAQALAHAKVVAQARAARIAAAQRANRAAVRVVYFGSTRALGQSLAAAHGWTGVQFSCLDQIWTHESNWRTTALNSSGGAYGIPQAQPGSKMASAGSDWRTNPATQIRWGLTYIGNSYGTPCAAWSFWQAHQWY